MTRWLLLGACVLAFLAVSMGDPARAPDAKSLGGICESTHECVRGTTCVDHEDVMHGQCSSPCNSSAWCEERFGRASVCLGADLCARTCLEGEPCPSGTICNGYGWCERAESTQ